MANRFGLTLRFNQQEQQELRELCTYYGKDPKTVLKMAFFLMCDSTDALKRKREKEQQDANQQATNSANNPDQSGASSNPADAAPSDELQQSADAGSADAQPATADNQQVD